MERVSLGDSLAIDNVGVENLKFMAASPGTALKAQIAANPPPILEKKTTKMVDVFVLNCWSL
jgi:hypothetical protein